MKPHKSTFLVLVIGLLLVVFAVALGQNASQNDSAKKSEASCSMDSCCCKGDSCPMNEGASASDAKDTCCCCNGESCDMKAHESMKNHATEGGCCCCSGDSCAMKSHDTMKSHAADHECCCDMKMKNKNTKAKQKAA